ncbi:MAG: hypothetical protein QM605_11905 [Sphingobium sp.]
MNAAEFREARRKLGLSIGELSKILDTSEVAIRRWEMDDSRNTARAPNPIACQVLRWLAEGRLHLD